jgi:hypothetical protein
MKDDSIHPFDDPKLKAALRQALGREAAPADLRARVMALASSSKPAPLAGARSDQPIPIRPRRGPLYKLAVAAVLVLGFGSLAYQIWDMRRPPGGYQTDLAISDALFDAMVKTHNARVAAGGAAGDTVTALASAGDLGRQVGRPVWAADLTKDGWTFVGGAVRDVAKNPTGQLFFTKGNAAISVLSMPASAASDAIEGQKYERMFGGTPIAGFVKGKGLFCIVGTSSDGSLKLPDVAGLLGKHRDEIVGG